MLRIDMKVIIGDKYAERFSYNSIAGERGKIVKIRDGYCIVKVKGDKWYIQNPDCLPWNPVNNKAATMLLEKEW
jgi:membrane protein implicated in regulation of membrane protease activity